MLILNFTYPLRCRRIPLGVRVPPVEYHCIREQKRGRQVYYSDPNFVINTFTYLGCKISYEEEKDIT
jgi:hypothetical protein